MARRKAVDGVDEDFISRLSPEDVQKWPKMPAFLRAYATCGTIGDSARAAQVGRQRHYIWLAECTAYPALFAAAKAEFAETLERKAFELVRELRPGQSPILLITLLNAHLPDKYRPNQAQGDEQAQRTLDAITARKPRKLAAVS